MSRRLIVADVFRYALVLAGFFVIATSQMVGEEPETAPASQRGGLARGAAPPCLPSTLGSAYIPVDSWVYPAVLRLYSLGFVDNVYLGMRPWTRSSLSHMLEETGSRLQDAAGGTSVNEAEGIYEKLNRDLLLDTEGPCLTHKGNAQVESVYSIVRGISGTPLHDSFHLGSTIVNDYGRPYENGFNNYSGASGYASAGRFLLYLRGEFHEAPSAAGYSNALAQELSMMDGVTFINAATGLPYNQATIPMGPIANTTDGRFIEAYLSTRLIGNEISFGKQDEWLGPGLGGAMAYSNNAENIYALHINRVEPLYIPLLSEITGPFRYEFLVGALRGHTFIPNPANPGGLNPNLPNVLNPGDPWVHLEKLSFRPTENLEFGFERTVIWGGQGHEGINLHSFLRSFFSTTAGSCPGNKCGPYDPGARFGAFDFSYRLPFARRWLTLYTDSEVHDDVSPADAPRRASYRPGLYLSHVPGVSRLDLRVEAASTDPSSSNTASQYGRFMYWETIQRQGYTNQGQLFGDWIGREDKGGQGWITYHLSGNEWIQVGVRNQKATTYFIPGGTTLNDINVQLVKRIGRDLEINGNFAHESWKAPIYPSGQPTYPASQHGVTTTTIQLTWFPQRKISF